MGLRGPATPTRAMPVPRYSYNCRCTSRFGRIGVGGVIGMIGMIGIVRIVRVERRGLGRLKQRRKRLNQRRRIMLVTVVCPLVTGRTVAMALTMAVTMA